MNARSARSNEISVIPEPARWERRPGRFTLTAQTAIVSDAGARPMARLLRDLLAPPTGFPLPLKDIADHGGETEEIAIVTATDRAGLGDEGYLLQAEETHLTLLSSAPGGAFYGIQTLRQLLPPETERRSPVSGVEWSVPCLQIEDAPRFPWRGVMLDEGRHFFGKDVVKRMPDLKRLLSLFRAPQGERQVL
jgi:hexosaminidase